jgi:catechol 2,3-dioxygenase-like lactoylglutathione lyase family enzyme
MTTSITQIGTVVVPVGEQDKAIEFYVEKLGFHKYADTPYGRDERWVEVGPAGGATTLALIPPREGEPVGIDTHVAFASEDVESDHARLQASGVDVDEAVMRMGGPNPPMFFFRDPDANSFLIVERSQPSPARR